LGKCCFPKQAHGGTQNSTRKARIFWVVERISKEKWACEQGDAAPDIGTCFGIMV